MKKIEKALLDRTPEDVIYIGDVAERMYNGSGGDLLRAIVKGFQAEEINRHKYDKTVNSDLKMGRIEGMQMIIEAIETAIASRQALVEESKAKIISEEI